MSYERMTSDVFHGWQDGMDDLFELVDGVPRPTSRASNLHDDVVVNLLAALKGACRGGPFHPFTHDTGFLTGNGNFRRPDAGLDAGPRSPEARAAGRAVLAVDVLSLGEGLDGISDRLDDYRSTGSLVHVAALRCDAPQAAVWRRHREGGWTWTATFGNSGFLDLPELGFALAMGSLYGDVVVANDPRARSP